MSYLRLKCNKFDFGWSSAYSTPPAGRVRRLHRLFSCEADSTTKNDFLPSKGGAKGRKGSGEGNEDAKNSPLKSHVPFNQGARLTPMFSYIYSRHYRISTDYVGVAAICCYCCHSIYSPS